MKRSDIIRRAGRNLRQAKLRTFLTALAISVGAFTITLALAAGTGAQSYTSSLISSNGDTRSLNVFAKSEQGQSPQNSGPQKYGAAEATSKPNMLNTHDVKKIQKIDGVENVTPMYSVNATYMVGQNQQKYDTSLSIKVDYTGIDLAAGSLSNNQPKPGTVIIPESYVEPLGYKSAADAVGKSITLNVPKPTLPGVPAVGKDITYTVAAVSKKTDMVLQYQNSVWLSPSDGQTIYAYETPPQAADEYYGMTVQVKKSADPATVQQAIKDKGYEVFSIQDVQKLLFTFVGVVMGGVAGFGALAILASIFGIINTQYISVLERTQQIGLMKALGARRKDIGRLFRYEAAWVGFLGGVLGTILALLVGLTNPLITDKLSLEKGTNLLVYKPLYSVILILALMLIAVIAGYFPSRKAAKLDPIEALRTE